MSVKEYALKVYQLSRYAPDLVADMHARMIKFSSGLDWYFILESKTAMLIKDIDIYSFTIHIQKIEDEKRK